MSKFEIGELTITANMPPNRRLRAIEIKCDLSENQMLKFIVGLQAYLDNFNVNS